METEKAEISRNRKIKEIYMAIKNPLFRLSSNKNYTRASISFLSVF